MGLDNIARSRRVCGVLLAGLLSLPALPTQAVQQLLEDPGSRWESQELIAKGGKGGGGNRKGGGNSGGGSRAKASKGASGFKSSGSSLNRGSNKPNGGWTSKSNQKSGPSLDKPRGSNQPRATDQRKASDNRKVSKADGRREDRAKNQKQHQKDRDKRRDDRWDQRDKHWDKRAKQWDKRWDRWDRYPGWARPGWGYARPWNTGWYGGWGTPRWSWWGPNAAAWGVTSLATAAIINAAVDNAVASHNTTIVVPNTDYRLLYGSVEPVNDQTVSFAVESGDREVALNADCERGTLDGQNPRTAQEAELLNAACQVAFGSV
jgi:hypothetical protein